MIVTVDVFSPLLQESVEHSIERVLTLTAEIHNFGRGYQRKAHAKAKKASDVGHEARAGHAFVTDDPCGEGIFDINVQPK